MNYQDFIPPILVHYLKKFIPLRTDALSPKFFLTYAEAQDACADMGYEDVGLIEVIFEKTRLHRDQMLDGKLPFSDSTTQSLLAALLAVRTGDKQSECNIIDFGGACGTHYFQLRPFLPSDLKLDWMVVETPTMVKKAKEFETNELRFCNSLSEAREKLRTVDLVHSSGALQYVPDPQTTIQELMECQPAHIFLNRLALSTTEIIITVQESFLSANGPGVLPEGLNDRVCRYPVTYFPKRRLEEMLSQHYQVIIEFADTKTTISEREIFVNTSIFAERFR